MDQSQRIEELVRTVSARVPLDAAAVLARERPETVAAVLAHLPRKLMQHIVEYLPPHLRPQASPSAWIDLEIPERVADLMEPVLGDILETATVQDAIEYLRAADHARQITYLYTTDADGRLTGLVVIRDLLLARPEQSLTEVMLPDPFALHARMPAGEAIRAAVHRHYPVYPVVDAERRLVGLVRGWRLFERQAIEITAQSGQMVGVDKDERVHTRLWQAFRMRHPWLQLNLLTAFLAAFVVGMFEDTITRIVALAAFLPVLAGQSGNTGCQALAITLRGLTLGDLDTYPIGKLLRKEAALGALNGVLVGLVAGIAMWLYATRTGAPDAPMLALTIVLAMTGACTGSGIFGVLVPVTLRRLGADPATASSIFLTTATDVLGMGLMLVLATTLVL
ncbi:magnesium transporter [Fontimonas thermophila]|uniref:Magnesium transporter n=1 Tax=Fontimonas thermophila TaxID=1076937 RepID=A0A1I2H0H8_9GAMM|nr:magnesium transporter [Fontimonas thermophila]SFF23162.1 magnesium transporter [Fontimonas thermophila]